MKAHTKYLAAGVALVATLGVVGAVQAHDNERGRGPGYHQGDHHRGDGHHRWGRGDRDGRGGRGGHHGFGPGMGMGGFGGPGHGMGGKMMMMRVFQLADTDGDRSVTQEDIDAFLQDRMQQYDENGDGQLQLDEYKAFFAELVEPMAVRTFQFLDPDGDAALTDEEFSGRLDGIVERMDRDGDGALTMQDHRRGGFGRRGWNDDDNRPRFRGDGPGRGMMQQQDDADDDADDTSAQ